MKTKQQLRYLAAITFTVMLFTLAETYTNPLEGNHPDSHLILGSIACLDPSMFTSITIKTCSTFVFLLLVSALEDLYKSLNNPQQLRGWRFEGGGDPCGGLWMGVYCSGSSIVAL